MHIGVEIEIFFLFLNNENFFSSVFGFVLLKKISIFPPPFFLNLEMAQLGNYDSGTAETPETDESLSVSIFPDEIRCQFFCFLASGDFGLC